MAPHVPDEIIHAILEPILRVPDAAFSCTAVDESPFAARRQSTSTLLLVCKSWLHICTPLLYNVVVLRSTAQAQSLLAINPGGPCSSIQHLDAHSTRAARVLLELPGTFRLAIQCMLPVTPSSSGTRARQLEPPMFSDPPTYIPHHPKLQRHSSRSLERLEQPNPLQSSTHAHSSSSSSNIRSNPLECTSHGSSQLDLNNSGLEVGSSRFEGSASTRRLEQLDACLERLEQTERARFSEFSIQRKSEMTSGSSHSASSGGSSEKIARVGPRLVQVA
ncbi:hypothetical protein FB45DRAFT_920712 [Roridomyces roridus]|uniref:Uncharacterized protein n=1 Tax=Roridomyces roridus TaxID=1738132 RepID=A0AAD7BPQ7_9AGAR|nr:hypothetical protein FB45DRAFT_920712 [Roridomyces roridus]